MKIESIHIRSFGRLTDYTCRFDGRMQIIEGENEAGKSTVAAFIRYMLYGFPRAGGSELSEKKKRIRWQDGSAAGSMTVSLSDGRRYRIERATTASGGTGTRETHREVTAIIDLETNTPLPGNESAGERFLGVPEEVFLSTAFVGQIGSPRVGGQALTEAIENLLFAGSENLNMQHAEEKLDQLRRTLLYKNGKGGEIYDLERQERDLLDRLSVAQEKNGELLTKEAELAHTNDKIEEVERELATATVRETNARNALLTEAYEHLHRAEREEAAAMEALREMDGMPAYRLQESDISDLKAARRRADEAERLFLNARRIREERPAVTLDEEEALLVSEAEREGGVSAVRRAAARTRVLFFVSLVAALLFVGTAAVGLLLLPPLSYILLGIGAAFALGASAAVAFTLAALLRRYRRYGVKSYGDFVLRIAEIEARLLTLREAENASAEAAGEETRLATEYHRMLSELDTVCRRFGARLPNEDIVVFLDSLEDGARRVMAKKKSYEDARVSATEKITILRTQLAGIDEAAVREAVPSGYEWDMQRENPELLRKKKEFFLSQQRALEIRRRDLENTLYAARGSAEDPGSLGGQLVDIETRLAAAREQHEACALAYEALEVAGERLRRGISPHLSHFAGRMMDRLTDGVYGNIGIAPDLTVTAETESGTRSLDYLSAGTQDLAYLSLRMALIDLLYKEKPPVCFDESFSHQDDTRAARMLDALETLTESGWQAIIFTCHDRESRLLSEKKGSVDVLRMLR